MDVTNIRAGGGIFGVFLFISKPIIIMEKEGPEKQIIPERTIPEHVYYSCLMCKFYKHQMVQSGEDPIYMRHCTHAEAPKMDSWKGNLHSTETPSWCPFLKDKEQANG